MAENSYSVLNAMVDIVAAPRTALSEVKTHASWLWWPLLIGILLASGMFYYYYNWVDFPWLVDETIRQLPAESRAESADGVRAFMQADTSMWTSIIAVVVMSFVIYLVQAAYFHLANKLTTGAAITYGQWFSFGVWTGFVGVFGSLAAFATMFMADSNQMATESLAVFSLNSLLFHASPGEPWFTWASSLTLINFWMMFLASIGYALWTGASMMKSTAIAVLPWVAIFGIWAITI
jgi:hypothetical protein